jgi:WXG100 family type VII secretion target
MTRDALKAEAGALASARRASGSAREDLLGQAQALYGSVSGQEGGWRGQGGSAFFALQENWFLKQKRVINILERFEAALRATDQDNVATDSAQRSRAARLNDRLG